MDFLVCNCWTVFKQGIFYKISIFNMCVSNIIEKHITCFCHKIKWHMSAFFKCFFTTIPVKPILPGKPRDYSYKSPMSRVLHKPPASQSIHSALVLQCPALHELTIDRCSAVLSYSANTLATSVLIAGDTCAIQLMFYPNKIPETSATIKVF